MPSKNELAASLTIDQAKQAGILGYKEGEAPISLMHTNAKRLFGFTRKRSPQGMPTEPKTYIYSVTAYGAACNLGAGFPTYIIHPCPPNQDHGEACVIDPVNFLEEAKVDQTEHTFLSGQDIANEILKIGPAMQASWDKRVNSGWFVSAHNPPLKGEIAQAKNLFSQHAKKLVEEANRYAASNKLTEINQSHRYASLWRGEKVEWDKPSRKMVACVGCQENILEGSIIHAVPYCGAIQPGKWPEAIANGMRTPEQLRMADPDLFNELFPDQKYPKLPKN